jgi:hypothetical protein
MSLPMELLLEDIEMPGRPQIVAPAPDGSCELERLE